MTQCNPERPALDPRPDILERYFLGRTDAFAAENRQEGGWVAVRKAIPPYLLNNHLSGKTTVAAYPVNTAGLTQWICFDMDAKSEAGKGLLLWLHRWFTDRGVLFLMEDTGGRGYHGWGLFLGWVMAEKAIALARLALADYTGKAGTLPCSVEVFPKQARPTDLGNPVRLPWGKHRFGRWSHFLNLSFEPDDENAIKLIQSGKKTTESDIDGLILHATPNKLEKPRLVPPDERWAEVIPTGKRHNTLLSLAGELKARALSSQQILAELKIHNAQRCSPPLPDKEVEEIAMDIAKKGESKPPAVKKHLLARFSELVDIVDNDGGVKYLMLNADEGAIVAAELNHEAVSCVPPSKEHLPFSLPRAKEVLSYIYGDNEHRLFSDLVAYLQRAAQLPTEMHYRLISWWVLHTYLYERFTYSPILALVGVPERGKTRLGRAVISLAYRGLETETLRESNLFRWSQDLGATIFLDVKDIWRKAEREKSEDILLKRYEKGGKVGRVLYPEKGPFRDTVYFDIYGPTIIASNEPIHHVLDTRCLPLILPDAGQKVWPDLDLRESLKLKERLVAFRARHMTKALPEYPKPPLGRLGDILQPLGVIMRLVSPEEEPTFQELTTLLWLERLEDRAQSREARLISAVSQCSIESGVVTISEVATAYNEGLEPRQQLSSKSVGRHLRTLGFKGVRQTGGVRAIIVEKELLATLKLRWGLELPEDTSVHPQKNVTNVKTSLQLQTQIQELSDISLDSSDVSPAQTPNSAQLRSDISGVSLQSGDSGISLRGGKGAEVDGYLPDDMPREDTSVHPQKNVTNVKTSLQLQTQTQELSDISLDSSDVSPAQTPNSAQLRSDISGVSLQSGDSGISLQIGKGAEVDGYLPDDMPREDTPVQPQKNATNAQTPLQLQTQTQELSDVSLDSSGVSPAQTPNSAQLRSDISGVSLQSGKDAEADCYLPDGTPVSCQELIRRWQNLGRPPIKVEPGKVIADLERFLADDVDLERLAHVVQFLNQGAKAQMGQDKFTQTLGMTVEQAIDLWRQEGSPVIHLGPGEDCVGLEKLLSHSDINPRHLLVVKGWLQQHCSPAPLQDGPA